MLLRVGDVKNWTEATPTHFIVETTRHISTSICMRRLHHLRDRFMSYARSLSVPQTTSGVIHTRSCHVHTNLSVTSLFRGICSQTDDANRCIHSQAFTSTHGTVQRKQVTRNLITQTHKYVNMQVQNQMHCYMAKAPPSPLTDNRRHTYTFTTNNTQHTA